MIKKSVIQFIVIGIIVMIVLGIYIIFQGVSWGSNEYKIQDLTPKYKTTVYMYGDYLDPNITVSEFPPITSSLNWKASSYLYEIRNLYPLKPENIKEILEEFFKEKPKNVFEIIPQDGIYDLIEKERYENKEDVCCSKTITKDGKILNDTYLSYSQFYPAPKNGEFADIERRFGAYILPQDGPSVRPYRDWMLFLDENFSWEFEKISDVKYDKVESIKTVYRNMTLNETTRTGGVFIFRKIDVKYYVEGIENINGRDCFKVRIHQYQELELIRPKNKEEIQYPSTSPEQQLPTNISSTHYSIMWVDKNERILVKAVEYYPSFLSYETTLK